jgi:SPP1 gp7 family putative phage head morphogenesis protein
MPPFLKAIPKDHPHRRQIGKLEKEAQAIIEKALSQLRRDLFRGIDRGNVYELQQRLQSREINEQLRQSIYKFLIMTAEAGGQVGQQQVEREVFGIKAPPPLITIDWTLVNSAVAEWAKDQSFLLTYANVWSITNNMTGKLRTEIDNFIRDPKMTINELERRLIPFFDETRAGMIAITEVTRAFAEGNRLAWKESGVVERKRWNTANDELVCLICGPLNGTVVDIDDVFDSNYAGPPAHPRCRCWITPVVGIMDDET